MTASSIVHSTFVVERTYPTTAARVFAAFSNPKTKRRWFAEGEGWQIDEFNVDFRVGGRETSRFRFKDGLPIGNDTVYQDIVTDKRIVSGKPDAKGHLQLAAADGRGGPYQGLPQPLKDQAYLAVRLSLIEKVAGYKRLPIIVDDAFGTLDAAKRALAHKMLKAISGLTQVIHRTPEAPPQGFADVMVQGP